mmetsp:Transcript_108906/g.306922  ORF Transcript_108906/g.306922 Transcript_108906/m.306922 type:complete len:244 (-) Transcript_108906:209-940(-)
MGPHEFNPPPSSEKGEPGGAACSELECPRVNASPAVQVLVGTSKMAADDATLAARIAEVANRANGHQRFSVGEVRSRLSKGDDEPDANRVLHVAYRDGKVVGCCSSTVRVPWGAGGGHWGALAVDPDAQRTGVASALVAAAEQRLLERGCTRVQIEYHYCQGDAESERLRGWYEGKLGFSGSGSGFRCASKRLSPSTVARCASEPRIASGRTRSYTQSGRLHDDPADNLAAPTKTAGCSCSLL